MEDPPIKGSGYHELYFDPDGFSAAVAGVARAADQIGSAERQVDHAAGPADDFGAVSSAWSSFQQAWSARMSLATKAADQLTSQLPVVGHAYVSADEDSSPGSGTINAASIWSEGPDAGGQDISVHTSVVHLQGKK